MLITVTADAAPGTVDITVDLQGATYPAGTNLTINREDVLSGDAATVYDDVIVTSVIDRLAPLGRNLVYTATIDTDTAQSPFILDTTIPVISDRFGNSAVAATIYDWPEWQYESQTKTVRIPGRADPVTMIGPEQYPSSTVTMVTLTQADLSAFRALVASGQVLYVRAPCDAVESAYFVIKTRNERRVTKKGSDWRRLHECAVDHVASELYPSTGLFPAETLYAQ